MESISEMAANFAFTPMFPVFDVAHFILSCYGVRCDISGVSPLRKNPLACYVGCLLVCFAGGIISNFLLGLPLLAFIDDETSILTASFIWYLMFYSPKDIVYRMCDSLFVRIPVIAFKEIARARKVSAGISLAATLYPSGWLVMFVVGIAKGAGGSYMKIVDRLIRGTFSSQVNEFLTPSLDTKSTVIGAAILTLGKSGYFKIEYPQLVLMVSLGFVYLKIASVLLNMTNPYGYAENIFCNFVFGRVEEDSACPSKKEHFKDDTLSPASTWSKTKSE